MLLIQQRRKRSFVEAIHGMARLYNLEFNLEFGGLFVQTPYLHRATCIARESDIPFVYTL